LEYVLESLPKSVNEIFLTISAAYDLPESRIEKRFPKREIILFKEEEALGTGGPIRALEKYIKDDFVVLNGDILSSIDLSRLIKFHEKNKKSMGTISLYEVENPKPYGVIELGKDGKLKRFEEKPEEPFSNLINAGSYVFSKNILDHFPDSRQFNLEREVLAKVAKKMHGYGFEGYWMDCGTFGSFLEANRMLLAKKGTSIAVELEDPDVVKDVWLGQCRIRGGTIGPNTVIGDGCIISESTVSNSVIFENVRIDSYSKIQTSIIGDNCKIGKNCYIEGCVLGDGIETQPDTRMKDKRLPRMA